MTSKRGNKFQVDTVASSSGLNSAWANTRNSSHHIHPVTNHPMSEGTISNMGPSRGNTSYSSNFSSPSCHFLCGISFSKGTSFQCYAKMSLTLSSDLNVGTSKDGFGSSKMFRFYYQDRFRGIRKVAKIWSNRRQMLSPLEQGRKRAHCASITSKPSLESFWYGSTGCQIKGTTANAYIAIVTLPPWFRFRIIDFIFWSINCSWSSEKVSLLALSSTPGSLCPWCFSFLQLRSLVH